MPGVEAIRQQDWLYAVFGRGGEVFARPTGCGKLFVGRRIARENFTTALAPTRIDPATRVVVAAVRPIDREWRVVVAHNAVIAASQYARGGVRDIAPGCPDEGMLAEIHWRPDPIFMLDVCEAEGRLWLVELNGFSCSWLYQCDLAAVVSQASELASQAWANSNRAKA
jgi:hypothetical protein